MRYDPFDVGVTYAYVGGQWVRCISEHYHAFHGRSEREVRTATAALREQARAHGQTFVLTARKLADFLATAQGQEAVFEQRLRDDEQKRVLAIIAGDSEAVTTGIEPKHTVWGWHSGHVVPQLDMLALVCYNLDVPMRRFLFDDVIVPYKGVVSGGRRLREWQGRATPRAHNWEDRRHYLESLPQEDGTTPPSMAEVARRLNQDERNLRYHLPNECRAISARYKQQLNIEKVRLERERMDRIRSAVRELHAQGINPTAQRMLPLGGGGAFYKKVFRETYKEARRELDVGMPNSGA